MAQALLEEVLYDADGNPQTSTLADYPFVSATELPSFELVDMATPTPMNPLGAKGIGEAGTIGSTPAVHNAVIDAVAHGFTRPGTPPELLRPFVERYHRMLDRVEDKGSHALVESLVFEFYPRPVADRGLLDAIAAGTAAVAAAGATTRSERMPSPTIPGLHASSYVPSPRSTVRS